MMMMIESARIIDVYSGVGGLSLAAARAGFAVSGAIEQEKRIIESHAVNFPRSVHLCADAASISGKQVVEKTKCSGSYPIGLIGGPPCQGFSVIGKKNVRDERNDHFSNFFRLVREIQPAFYMAENVPNILHERYDDLRAEAMKLVQKRYSCLIPVVVAANQYGAATVRTRVLFIGVRKDVAGAENILKEIAKVKSENGVYVEQAIAGLPADVSEKWQDYVSSWRKVTYDSSNKYVVSVNRLLENVGDAAAIKRCNR